MKTLINRIIIFTVTVITTAFCQAATLTPQEVATKAASVVSDSKGLTASFDITSNGRTTSGTLKSAGVKFCVLLKEGSIWYNGKSLYTYNPRTSETTVTVPTKGELQEANPLMYVKNGISDYNITFSPVKRTGKYVLDLVPKKKHTGINKLTFTIDASNFRTEKIVLSLSGGITTVNIKSLQTGQTLPASEFEYPTTKYPKAEIVDLR